MVEPVLAPHEAEPTVAMVRGYFLAHERERGRVYSNRERLGMIIALDTVKVAS